MANLGRMTTANRGAEVLAFCEGMLYAGAFMSAHISVYDPQQPCSFGTETGNNPRDIGPIQYEQNRVSSMEVGPDCNLWIASAPQNCLYGGALTRLLPEPMQTTVWRDIITDQSVTSLAMDPKHELVWAGTEIDGGPGTVPRATEAVLFAFHPYLEEKVFECVPLPGEPGLAALELGSDWLVYGAARDTPEMFVFDPESRTVVARGRLPDRIRPEAMQLGKDGCVYGMAQETFFRIHPRSHRVETLGRCHGATYGLALIGTDVYFARGPVLCVGHLPAGR